MQCIYLSQFQFPVSSSKQTDCPSHSGDVRGSGGTDFTLSELFTLLDLRTTRWLKRCHKNQCWFCLVAIKEKKNTFFFFFFLSSLPIPPCPYYENWKWIQAKTEQTIQFEVMKAKITSFSAFTMKFAWGAL